jgi:hypothetical protein
MILRFLKCHRGRVLTEREITARFGNVNPILTELVRGKMLAATYQHSHENIHIGLQLTPSGWELARAMTRRA